MQVRANETMVTASHVQKVMNKLYRIFFLEMIWKKCPFYILSIKNIILHLLRCRAVKRHNTRIPGQHERAKVDRAMGVLDHVPLAGSL